MNELYVTRTTARSKRPAGVLQGFLCQDSVYISRHLTTVSAPMSMLRVSVHSRQRETQDVAIRRR